MGVIAMNVPKYRALVAKALPKVIETDEEFDHFVEMLEALDRKSDLTPEEKTLEVLLAKLIQDYDDRIELPKVPAHEMIRFLMEHKGLRQADLLPVFGSRSVVSDVLAGKREPSKAHIRKLAEFFKLSPEVFF
jgi:HTH-type transcriptional regulator / antitoxin HigA